MDYAQQVVQIQTNLQRQTDAVEADPRLSDDAKATDITALHVAADARHKNTMAQWNAADAAELKRTQQAAWSDADPVSFRAALAQVGSIADLPTARLAMSRAILTADAQQAKALALVATEKGFTEVVNMFIKEYPAAGAAIQRADAASAAASDPARAFLRNWTSCLPKPPRSNFKG